MPTDRSVPELSELDVRLPRAQQHFAVVVNTALWMDTFSGASAPLRARMLSMAKPGAMSALFAVPSNHHGARSVAPMAIMTWATQGAGIQPHVNRQRPPRRTQEGTHGTYR